MQLKKGELADTITTGIEIEDMEEKEGTEIITQQLPKAGIKVKEGVAIIAYN